MDIDHNSGDHLNDWDSVVQSIFTILTTPIGSRVFNRDFGSRLPEQIDAPQNDASRLALYVAVAEALEDWEPRFALQQVHLTGDETGKAYLEMIGLYLPRGHLGDRSAQKAAQLRLDPKNKAGSRGTIFSD